MKLLDKLDRKIGRYAIRNLMLYIIVLNVVTYFFLNIAPIEMTIGLALIPQLIKQGEIWRLISFIAYPPEVSIYFMAFALYLYYMIGTTLEHEWGSFKFNIYYFCGVICTIIGSFITGYPVLTAYYLNMSLFLAFARLYPDHTLMVFFVLPVKMKWLAWLNWIYFAQLIFRGDNSMKLMVIAAVINYFIFFGKDIITNTKSASTGYYRKREYQSKMKDLHKDYHHKCTVCGRTELDDKEIEFRYCSKCDGYYEYCMDHLHNHSHIKKDHSQE